MDCRHRPAVENTGELHMEGIRETRQFGRRETGSIVISSNGKVREYKISKTVAITAICACVMLMSGYLAATAYLLFRDDVLTASLANQVRMKHEYEDRIAALRRYQDGAWYAPGNAHLDHRAIIRHHRK